MKKVCLFDFAPSSNIDGFHIESFNPLSYFKTRRHRPFSDFLVGGMNGCIYARELFRAESVDRLYRERDPAYMRMVGDFVERFREYDVIVFLQYNFVHPEILVRELKKPKKILGFGDDPLSTYVRGIPYLWAFDGLFYISPGYIDDLRFDEAARRWSDIPSRWWPLVTKPFMRPTKVDEEFFSGRQFDVTYVGNAYGPKIDRLIALKKHFGERFGVYGRWPFLGYHGLVRGLQGKPMFPHRVTGLSDEKRTEIYWNTKIGINLHFSDTPTETGNMRMYEVPAHGMMLICDKAAADVHEDIFEPGVEAMYYGSTNEAIEMIEYFLGREEERVKIAKAGFERFWRDYEWKGNLVNLLEWASSLERASDG